MELTQSCLSIKCRRGTPHLGLAEWASALRCNDKEAWHSSDRKALASSVTEVVQVIAPRWEWEKIQTGNQERSSGTAQAAGKKWDKPKGRCWEAKRVLSFIQAFPFYNNLAGLGLRLFFWFVWCGHDASYDLCVQWAWQALVTAAADFVRLSSRLLFLGVGKWRIPSSHHSAGMKHGEQRFDRLQCYGISAELPAYSD